MALINANKPKKKLIDAIKPKIPNNKTEGKEPKKFKFSYLLVSTSTWAEIFLKICDFLNKLSNLNEQVIAPKSSTMASYLNIDTLNFGFKQITSLRTQKKKKSTHWNSHMCRCLTPLALNLACKCSLVFSGVWDAIVDFSSPWIIFLHLKSKTFCPLSSHSLWSMP